jgi:large subunit ribosomal protein L35
MPKQKTHKGAKSRLKVTGSGKITMRSIGVNNFRRKKRRQTSGQFDEMREVHPSLRKPLKKLLPYK